MHQIILTPEDLSLARRLARGGCDCREVALVLDVEALDLLLQYGGAIWSEREIRRMCHVEESENR